jgi:4-amino-4-deoxy-L-arabinose transferase-like glycosyltransferase
MHDSKLKYVILSVILAGLFAYPFVLLPFGTDQGIFAYIGSIINNGGVPYLSAWDVKPPLIYYIYSLGLRLFGHSMIGIRCFDLLYFSITMFAIYYLGILLFDKRTGVCAGLILGILYFFTNDYWSFSQAESFMILPMVLSVYLCWCGIKKQSMIRLLCSGVFLGIAVMIKLTGMVMVIPIGAYILGEFYFQRGNRAARLMAIRFFMVFMGFLLSSGSTILWVYMHGAISEMYYTLFVYDPAYLSSASSIKTDYVHLSFAGFMRRYLFLLIPALLSTLVINDKKKILENILIYSWFFSALLGFLMQVRFYHYHMLPVIAPLSLLGAQGLVDLYSASAWQKQFIIRIRKLVIVPIIALLFLAAVWPHIISTYHFTINLLQKDKQEFYNCFFLAPGVFSLHTTIKATQYIKDHTSPNDSIFVWGFQPLLHFLPERQSPTRFFLIPPLLRPLTLKKMNGGGSCLPACRRRCLVILL